MLKDNIFLIINPNASKGKGQKKAEKIAEHFKKNGRECTIAYTKWPRHAKDLAHSGVENGFGTIVAAGGDGTVNEVINGIMSAKGHEDVKMGIIPIGRGNDFAWMAKIPSKDIIEATDLIINGEAKDTDVGLAVGSENEDGMYFLNGMGFGFEPMVNFTAMDYKHLNGMPSYIVAFFKILFSKHDGYHMRLKIDGNEVDLNTQQLSVNNGRRMGSTFLMTPRAEIDDGKLDVMYTNKCERGFRFLSLVFGFLKGKMVSDKERFTYLRADSISVEILDGKTSPLHSDGEVFSKNAQYANISIIPSGVKLFRP